MHFLGQKVGARNREKMCSHTSSGNGSHKNGVDLSSCSKKPLQKRARVPKRGPGVAELEKILREEATGVNIHDGFSSPAIFKTPVTVAPSFFTSLRSSLAGTSGGSSSVKGRVGKNEVPSVSPEKALFPFSWKAKSDLVDDCRSENGGLTERYFLEQRHPLIRYFPGSGWPSPARMIDPIEHPSSQKSNLCKPFWVEKEKVIGMKRPQHFSGDGISQTFSREDDSRNYGAFNGGFHSSSSPKADSPSEPRCQKQKTMDDCNQRSEEVENDKPFYCFLQLPHTTNSLDKEMDEADPDAIDLNLKL